MSEIENPMVVDSLWKDKKDLRVVGLCAGCQDEICEGEDIYEYDDYGEIIFIHQKPSCCMDYVAEMSVCKTAQK